MSIKAKLEHLEKEAEKQEPEEEYTTEISEDGHHLIGRRGDKIVIELHYPNIDLNLL